MPHDRNICQNLSFSDCELAILRMAIDNAEEKMGKRLVNTSEMQKIIDIVELFLVKKKLVCYGGTAINNILPEQDRFYNKYVEIPDYDFFSTNALNDAKELADIYYNKGFINVEAKAGQHHGTYKVFVNYFPVADITYLPTEIFKIIKKDAIIANGIAYAPPNFLRMSMYLELSRPAGDISRWEKVLKRLTLLNKNYNITENENVCNKIIFQRPMSHNSNEIKIQENIKNTLINEGVVFLGGFANSLYSIYMPKKFKNKIQNMADFDILSNDPEATANIVKERLNDIDIHKIKIIKHEAIGEIIPEHYELKIDKDSVLFIYKPIGCHSYNIIEMKGKKIKVATIDTMLSFYLAFLYVDRPYYNEFTDRILCMSKFLFDVQQKNRLSQRGLLKRFSITCYGHQLTIEEMKSEKAKMYEELKKNRNPKLFEEWFLNYKPDDKHNKIISKERKVRTKKKRNTQKKNFYKFIGLKTLKNRKQ